jgi:hypothetical protein
MKTEIEFRAHKGVKQTPLGPVEVELKQWLVMARTEWTGERWMHVGYICYPCKTNPTPPFNGLDVFRKLPQEYKDLIAAQVQSQVGTETMRVYEPPKPELPDEEVDES